ncbi:hypothetical protein DERP_007621 [Dermatophagoides pteronyssinus]|uniref:Tyrosine aminotransferase n=1 Tax=Dermatophagoides pteronyssinus TaxID=6956 RepID=A0ABQ8JKE8_DERPT|nr:hypothetical protein DERP_007621 [Dermatophagoides pteronyssinus]
MESTVTKASSIPFSMTNGFSSSPSPPISTEYDNNDSISESLKITESREWSIRASPKALATINPIRKIVETMNLTPNREKPFIPLSIGDPTLFGNFKPCDEILDAMLTTVNSSKFNGYQPASGNEEARKAVAEYCSSYGMNVEAKDIVLSSGCSHALDMAMAILATPGCNMLVPRPGFPLYKTLSATIGVQIKYYNLLPERNWQIDIDDLESKIDENTAAIIYNNPSNPCGSVFPENHIRQLLNVAERHHIPIIADEIYENIVFPGHEFHAIASLTDEVPVFHCSGTTKKFLIPGWRLGWIAINDKKDRFGIDIRTGLNSLSQRIIGPNSLIQGAIGRILTKTPKSFFDEIITNVHRNADHAFNRLRTMKGLKPIQPAGAFYIMVHIEMKNFPAFHHDLHLVETLVSEESVFCLPGACFEYPGYVRLVLAIDYEMLDEAMDRIESFTNRYFVNDQITDESNDLDIQMN